MKRQTTTNTIAEIKRLNQAGKHDTEIGELLGIDALVVRRWRIRLGLPKVKGYHRSSVCVALAQTAGIPFEVAHNHTTADAPETVYFVREEFKRLEGLDIKCTINYPVYKGQRTSIDFPVCGTPPSSPPICPSTAGTPTPGSG